MRKKSFLYTVGIVFLVTLSSCSKQMDNDLEATSKLTQYEHVIIEENERTDSQVENQEDNHMEKDRVFTDNLKDLAVVDTSKQVYTYDEMLEDLEVLENEYPELVTLNTLTTTKDDRSVYEVVIGKEDAKNHIMIHAGIHAREYMTSLLLMKQLEYYLYNYSVGDYEGTTYSELFSDTVFHIIPMVNPDGVSISQNGLDGIKSDEIKKDAKTWYDRDYANGATTVSFETYLKRWKANGNGVDLNRNFDYGWEEFVGSSEQGAEKYKGEVVNSEPEAQALVALTKKYNPVAAISYHATGSVIYWDYGQTDELRDECETLAETIHKVTGYEIKYAATDKQDAAGYGDWIVMKEHIPSATIEIGTGTAPLGIDEFSNIWEENKELWAALVDLYR